MWLACHSISVHGSWLAWPIQLACLGLPVQYGPAACAAYSILVHGQNGLPTIACLPTVAHQYGPACCLPTLFQCVTSLPPLLCQSHSTGNSRTQARPGSPYQLNTKATHQCKWFLTIRHYFMYHTWLYQAVRSLTLVYLLVPNHQKDTIPYPGTPTPYSNSGQSSLQLP